jgi:hypothetical protein
VTDARPKVALWEYARDEGHRAAARVALDRLFKPDLEAAIVSARAHDVTLKIVRGKLAPGLSSSDGAPLPVLVALPTAQASRRLRLHGRGHTVHVSTRRMSAPRVSPFLPARLRVLSRTSDDLSAALKGLPKCELPIDAGGRAELLRYTKKLLRDLAAVERSSRELTRRLTA